MQLEEAVPYEILESRRARNIRIRVSREGRLSVIVPAGFCTDRVPGVLEKKREWIRRALARFSEAAIPATKGNEDDPACLDLAAFGERWGILFDGKLSRSDDLVEERQKRRLVLGGAWHDPETPEKLRRWLILRSGRGLGPWLERLSARHALPFRKFAVRIQETRWGSCSAKGTISLNAKLAFLSPHLVDYVLCHELCHTRHFDHSRQFWALLERVLPESRFFRKLLREAGFCIPPWVQPKAGTGRFASRGSLTFYLQ